jgi:ribosomal protein RSM22 (predicted rRNA methylase)
MPALPARPLRILDVGSGPGTAALAVLDHLTRLGQASHHGSEVIAADRSRQALHEAEALWASMTKGRPDKSRCAFRPMPADAERADARAPWKQGPFDLIMLANSLNELFCSAADPLAARVKLLEALLTALAPDGTLMIVEPALRETTRALHHVRDRLVAEGLATVYSPCLHERPCPALAREDGWCHEERPWTPPAVVQEIDRAVGFIKDALKFSYLLLRKDGLTIAERGPDVYRVVSEVMVMKGDRRAWLCNETGRPLVGRLNRSRSDANAAFDRWHRGAIVRVDQIARRGAVGRIGSEAKVELIRPVE